MQVDLKDHRVTYMHGSTTKTVAARDLTPLKAIRAKCLDCSGGSIHEAKLCVIPECSLHPFRFGKNPFRKPRTFRLSKQVPGQTTRCV